MTTKKRKPNRGQFRPGQSGNPGGRPRGLVELCKLARAYTPQALKVLVEVMADERASSVGARVRAAEALLNRAWGMPVEAIRVDGLMASIDTPSRVMTADDNLNLARRIAFWLHSTKREMHNP